MRWNDEKMEESHFNDADLLYCADVTVAVERKKIHRAASISNANGCFKCFESCCRNQDVDGCVRAVVSLRSVRIPGKDAFLLKLRD